jgi:hypothetical protein
MIEMPRPSLKLVADALLKHRLFVLIWTIFIVALVFTLKGLFVGDFWQHSAVIRELSTNILDPKHPQLLVNATHAFYSPYALALAFLSRIFHINSIQILSIMVVVNYWLFVYGLRAYIKSLYPDKYQPIVFYCFLLILFWWGWRPPNYSAFYHIGVLASILSYPSTFSMGITLIAISINNKAYKYSAITRMALIIIMASFVILTHPPTFIFLAVMLFVNVINNYSISIKALINCCVILGITAFLVVLWPYFSMIDLIIKEGSVYHLCNKYLYSGVLFKIWPMLLGVYLIVFRRRDEWHNRFLLALIILTAVYLYGYVSGNFTYGRLISFIAFILQLVIAIKMADWEKVGIKYRSKLIVPSKFVLLGVLIVCLLLSAYPISKMAYVTITRNSTFSEYLFLNNYVSQYNVVLSDLDSSWREPSFGGKVVAVKHPLAFVKDQVKRISDVNEFFAKKTSKKDRLDIISKYNVDFVLLNKNDMHDWRAIEKSLLPHVKLVYESNSFLLLSVVKS